MKSAAFNADGSRLLPAAVFERALAAELNRAMRTQTFVTLVAVEARRVWDGLTIAADDGTLAELAEILGISYKALLYKIKETGLDKNPSTP